MANITSVTPGCAYPPPVGENIPPAAIGTIGWPWANETKSVEAPDVFLIVMELIGLGKTMCMGIGF